MKYLLGILIILMISQICAVCENEQININTASKEELDELRGIGPVKAQAIIDTRTFDSLDDLNTIPERFAGMRSSFEKKFKDYQRSLREYNSSMGDWIDLQRIVDGEDVSVEFVWNVISEFEPENLRLEDMVVVE